jgi:hypothetical protein
MPDDDVTLKPHLLRRGSTGWIYGAAGIIIWDLLAGEEEQLTAAFRRGFKTRKVLVGASWLYLTGHLFGVIPEQFDIVHIAGHHYYRTRGPVGAWIVQRLEELQVSSNRVEAMNQAH